jgi:hypothetical protein
MRLIYLFSFLAFHFCCQGQYIQSATLSAGGSLGGNDGKYYLSHIVSQSSILAGTARNGSTVFRQGFKQPFARRGVAEAQTSALIVAEPSPTIQVNVFPNPFVDQIILRFSAQTRIPTRLTLYDASSKLIWERLFPENISEIPLIGFEEMQPGKYLLQIFQQGSPIVKTIIKEVQN